jgi:hypothetical protein
MLEETHIRLQSRGRLWGRKEELVPKIGSTGGNIGEGYGCG